jgi:hypothetical protein
VLSDDFAAPDGSDIDGTSPEVGGAWDTTTSGPILQIFNNAASIGPAGRDASAAFSSSIAHTDGTAIYIGFDISLSVALATGDYFFHVQSGSTPYNLVLARAATGGFQLGLADRADGTPTWGSDVLSLDTTYHVATSWSFAAGAVNDTFALYVDPTNAPLDANSPYLTHSWSSPSSEPATLSVANLRQGSAAVAPTLAFDNLRIGTDSSDVYSAATVPEVSSFLLVGVLGLGGLGKFLIWHWS